MGVSFKVSRKGVRYRKSFPSPPESYSDPVVGGGVVGVVNGGVRDGGVLVASDQTTCEGRVFQELGGNGDWVADDHHSVSLEHCGSNFDFQEREASFCLYLFPEGYSVGRASQDMLSSLLQGPKNLLPYDKASRDIFLAIEYGWLPADVFDDIPCQYINGTILCEVWDFRQCIDILDDLDCSRDDFPKSQKVCLKMAMENVIKDIPSISDESWTYSDLLKAESQILKALQPVLCLNPNFSLDRLCRIQSSKKIDLGIYCERLARKQQDQVVANNDHGNLFEGIKNIDHTEFENSRLHKDGTLQDGVISCHHHVASSIEPNSQFNSYDNDTVEWSKSTPSQETLHLEANFSEFIPKTVVTKSDLLPDLGSLLDMKSMKQKGQANRKPRIKRLKKETAQSVSDKQHAVQRPLCSEYETQFKNAPQPKLKPDDMRNHRSNEMVSALAIGRKFTDNISNSMSSVKQKVMKTVECEKHRKFEAESKKEDHSKNHSTEISNVQLSLLPDEQLPALVIGGKFTDKQLNPKLLIKNKVVIESVECEKHRKSEVETNKEDCSKKISTEIASVQRSLLPDESHLSLDMNSKTDIFIEGSSRKRNPRKRKYVQTTQASTRDPVQPPAPSKAGGISKHSLGPLLLTNKVTSKAQKESVCSRKASTEVKGDVGILQRFLKIKMVTQRFSLNSRKPKGIEKSKKKTVFHCPNKLINILKSEDVSDRHLASSTCNIPLTRILTFKHSRTSHDENTNQILACNCTKKLVLSYELNELGHYVLGAQIIFQDKLPVHIGILPNLIQANIFASQFASLMTYEGFELCEDRIHPLLANICSTVNTCSETFHMEPLLNYIKTFPDELLGCLTQSICSTSSTSFLQFLSQDVLPSDFPYNMTPSLYGNQLSILRNNITGSEATRNTMMNSGSSDYPGLRNVGQIYSDQIQTPGFYNINLQSFSSGSHSSIISPHKSTSSLSPTSLHNHSSIVSMMNNSHSAIQQHLIERHQNLNYQPTHWTYQQMLTQPPIDNRFLDAIDSTLELHNPSDFGNNSVSETTST